MMLVTTGCPPMCRPGKNIEFIHSLDTFEIFYTCLSAHSQVLQVPLQSSTVSIKIAKENNELEQDRGSVGLILVLASHFKPLSAGFPFAWFCYVLFVCLAAPWKNPVRLTHPRLQGLSTFCGSWFYLCLENEEHSIFFTCLQSSQSF